MAGRQKKRAAEAPARGAMPRDEAPAGARQPAVAADAIVLALLIVLYAVVVVRNAWLSDDAYITFRTIDNFVAGYGLRWNVAERVQAYTHPLWLFVLTPFYALTGEIYRTALLVSALCSLVAFTLLGLHARRRADAWLLAGGLGILCLSRAFVDYSTSGLENPLTHLLLVGFAVLLFETRAPSPRRIGALAVIAALGIVNRMDTALLFLPALAVLLWQARSRAALVTALAGFIPFAFWEAFSLVYYGFPFPNTAYAKLATGISRPEYWQHGLAYVANSLRWDPITLTAIAGGLAAALLAPDRRRLSLAVGAVLYVVYTVNIGGDFMAGRFFAAPLLVAVILLLEVGVPSWLRRPLPFVVFGVGCVGTAPTFLTTSGDGAVMREALDRAGIADERRIYFPLSGALSRRPVADRPVSLSHEIGLRAREQADPVLIEGAVGYAGFFAGPGTYVIDFHALGDPLMARLPMVQSDPLYAEFCAALSGACEGAWRTGHYLRNVPDGYVESILFDDDRLADAELRPLYDDLRRITRGPIWSAERWRAIARQNLGNSGLRSARPAYQPVLVAPVYERHPDVGSARLLRGAVSEYNQRGVSPAAPLLKLEALYRATAARHPTSWRAHASLVGILREQGRVQEAIDYMRQQLPHVRDQAGAYDELGVLLMESGDLPGASEQFQHALQLDPTLPSAHLNLARSRARLGDMTGAIEAFRQGVYFDPRASDAYSDLGAALAADGQLDAAIDALHLALRMNPGDANARGNLAEVEAMRAARPGG
ncbi:MAG: tetratricopeptide repeat protein [Deltaproteobacteria bacterium]|nr:tetratricopeptide repeat protein [Deltaproteobacteria bacterium]